MAFLKKPQRQVEFLLSGMDSIINSNICSGWGSYIIMLFLIVFWVFIVVALIALMRWIFSSKKIQAIKPEKTALEILKERYAKGEIDQFEFEEKKKNLQ